MENLRFKTAVSLTTQLASVYLSLLDLNHGSLESWYCDQAFAILTLKSAQSDAELQEKPLLESLQTTTSFKTSKVESVPI